MSAVFEAPTVIRIVFRASRRRMLILPGNPVFWFVGVDQAKNRREYAGPSIPAPRTCWAISRWLANQTSGKLAK